MDAPELDHAARPRVHFAAPSGWINDPNGLVYADGVYHLYFQYYPDDVRWGPMHWGHATSTDLIAWTHQPIALAPDELGTIFSGSAVVDTHNTAGFGADALVAVYTYNADDGQTQALAWSADGGTTFGKHAGNPVLPAPDGERDFRDPKVFRWGGIDGHWVMLLAVGHAIWIYTSADLRAWARTDVIEGLFSTAAVWETPELLSLPDEDGRPTWVLAVGIGDGAPAGGSGQQAAVGQFDGSRFTASDDAFWVDHGPAFYAAQAWNSTPDGRVIWIGWMGNWHVPADPTDTAIWRGQMSIPREITLRQNAEGHLRLAQQPIAELSKYVDRSLVASGVDVAIHLGHPLPVAATAMVITISFSHPDHHVTIICERADCLVHVSIDSGFVSVATGAPRAPMGDVAEVQILLDTASIEVFAGTAAISRVVPPSSDPWSVTIQTQDSQPTLDHLEAVTLVKP